MEKKIESKVSIFVLNNQFSFEPIGCEDRWASRSMSSLVLKPHLTSQWAEFHIYRYIYIYIGKIIVEKLKVCLSL